MKIAIKGHISRGKEIIQILKSLGATSYRIYDTCSHPEWYWYINKNKEITCDLKKSIRGYKFYTLEEFEKEFPFKIGDKVVCRENLYAPHTIIGISYNPSSCLQYEIKEDKTGIIVHYPTDLLVKYKEMKEERNITLTLDKAKEWYEKGGDLKQVALQAYSEEELTKVKLPKTWEEFCEKYPVKIGETWVGSYDTIYSATMTQSRIYKNWIPSRRSARAHLAMIQLEQLRDCWRQGWKPTPNQSAFAIKFAIDGLNVYEYCSREFLSFKDRKTATEFLKCFKDLIEKAGDLI